MTRDNERPRLPSPSELQQARAEYARLTGKLVLDERPIDREEHALEVIASAAAVSRQHDEFVSLRERQVPLVTAASTQLLVRVAATFLDLE